MWLVDNTGQKLSGTQTAAAFLELALRSTSGGESPRTVAVMVNQPHLFEEIAARHHASIKRTPIDVQALMTATLDPQVMLAMSGAGEFILPAFHRLIDAMYPLGKLLELLAKEKTRLGDVVATLPEYHMATRRVACPWDKKGLVMRLLNEQYRDQIVEQVDGVKIQLDEADWVLVVPESDEAVFTVVAEAGSPENAAALADRYVRVIEGMRS